MRAKIQKIQDRLKTIGDKSPEKVDLLNKLAWDIRTEDPRQAVRRAQEGYELAREIQYPRGIAYAKRNMGTVYYFQSDYEQAMPNLLEALQWFEENEEFDGVASVSSILGLAYWGFGDFQRGFDFTFKALNIFQRTKHANGEAWNLQSLATFYYDMKDYTRSLEYYRKACELFQEKENAAGEARALNGIGNVYHAMGDMEKALKFQDESLRIQQMTKNYFGESRTLNDIGVLYYTLEDYDKALKFFETSLRIRRDLQYHQGEVTTLLDMSDLHIARGEYETALEILGTALILAKKLRATPKIARAHHAFYKAYKAMNQTGKALEHFEKFHQIEEEVFHEDAETRVKNLQTAYQLESSQKEAEIYRLKNVELKEKNDQLKETLKKLNAAQAQLIQSEKMAALGNLVAGVVHELNSPVGAIRSAVDTFNRAVQKILSALDSDHIPREIKEDRALQKAVAVFRQNNENIIAASDRIMKISASLKNFARVDEAAYQKTNLLDGLESILTLIGSELKERVEIIKDFHPIPEIYCNPHELNQLFMNLILNALQAIKDRGTLTIQARAENQRIKIIISDTGKGIPAEKMADLFEPGFTQRDGKVRMRSGLYTSYHIVQKHRGEISVDSQPGKGATFTIELPVE